MKKKLWNALIIVPFIFGCQQGISQTVSPGVIALSKQLIISKAGQEYFDSVRYNWSSFNAYFNDTVQVVNHSGLINKYIPKRYHSFNLSFDGKETLIDKRSINLNDLEELALLWKKKVITEKAVLRKCLAVFPGRYKKDSKVGDYLSTRRCLVLPPIRFYTVLQYYYHDERIIVAWRIVKLGKNKGYNTEYIVDAFTGKRLAKRDYMDHCKGYRVTHQYYMRGDIKEYY